MRQVNNSRHQRQPLRSGGHVDHERAIDFQRVDWQLGEVTERRKAGAEIVDGDGDAERTDGFEDFDAVLDIFHDQALGEFQFESRRRLRVNGDNLLDLRDEVVVAQLQR